MCRGLGRAQGAVGALCNATFSRFGAKLCPLQGCLEVGHYLHGPWMAVYLEAFRAGVVYVESASRKLLVSLGPLDGFRCCARRQALRQVSAHCVR